MSTLIVYMTKHSTTEKIAGLIKDNIEDDRIDLVNLAKTKAPDPGSYDRVIVGGSIHIGQIQKKVKKFCQEYQDALLQKKLGLFMCYMLFEKEREELETNFSEELRNHAASIGLFGGEFLFENMNFFEKMITRKVAGTTGSVSKINDEAVQKFIEEMNA